MGFGLMQQGSPYVLRNHLILHVARTSGYSKVMMGDSGTRVAVKLLTNLCLGRGAFLAADTVRAGAADSHMLGPQRSMFLTLFALW